MKNIAIIFAGGSGTRMENSDKPKQFLELNNIPIIVHTIKKFQECSLIDGISVSILKEYIPLMQELKIKYELSKIEWIVEGGETGQMSIFNSLDEVSKDERVDEDAIVLIHDGVRPIIDENLILKNIAKTRTDGSAITVVKATETVFRSSNHLDVSEILDRTQLYNARAPQSFKLSEILSVHQQEILKGNVNNIDSCSMMSKYNYPISLILCKSSNIKITTYEDYYIFQTLYNLELSRKEQSTLK